MSRVALLEGVPGQQRVNTIHRVIFPLEISTRAARLCRTEMLLCGRLWLAQLFDLKVLPGGILFLGFFGINFATLVAIQLTHSGDSLQSINDDGSPKIMRALMLVCLTCLAYFAFGLVILALMARRLHQKQVSEVVAKTHRSKREQESLNSVAYFKDTKGLWDSFFSHMGRGTFMISYSPVEPILPKALANQIGCPLCWLDTNELVPGIPITESCASAAKNAMFRFVFLSGDYVFSKNCMVELAQIIGEPGKCFIFVYDTEFLNDLCWANTILPVPPSTIDQLEAQGHFVYKLSTLFRQNLIQTKSKRPWSSRPSLSQLQISFPFVLSEMIATRAVLPMFRQKPPPINAYWMHTVTRAIVFKHGLRRGPTVAFILVIVPILLPQLGILFWSSIVGGMAYYSVMILGLCSVFFYLGFISLLYRSYEMAMYLPRFRRLSDSALLLILLRTLELTKTIPVRMNKRLNSSFVATLEKYGVLRVIPWGATNSGAKHNTNTTPTSTTNVVANANHSNNDNNDSNNNANGSSNTSDNQSKDTVTITVTDNNENVGTTNTKDSGDNGSGSDSNNNTNTTTTTNATTTTTNNSAHINQNDPNQLVPTSFTHAFSIVHCDSLEDFANAPPLEASIFWSDGEFSSLGPLLRTALADSMVGTGEPSQDAVCVPLLGYALGCPLENLTMGEYPFPSSVTPQPSLVSHVLPSFRPPTITALNVVPTAQIKSRVVRPAYVVWRISLNTLRAILVAVLVGVAMLLLLAGLFMIVSYPAFDVRMIIPDTLNGTVVCTREQGCIHIARCAADSSFFWTNNTHMCVKDDVSVYMEGTAGFYTYTHPDLTGRMTCTYTPHNTHPYICSFFPN